jgi:hypothetical protein
MVSAGLDGLNPTSLALAEIGGGEQITDGENPGERGTHLMRKRGERSLDDARG